MASIDPKAIPSPSPGSIIDLSKQYIYRHQITSFHGRRNIHSFLMEGSVMIDTTPESMQELQNLLTELSPQRIVFAKSNVSGRVFYKGKEFMVENPVEEHVTVESTGPDGRPVVRDDSPPRTFHDGSTIYHFVKTVYDPATNKFFRYYVILDWLKSLVEMDMSGTSISGYGLTSLVAASASRLESLKLTGCAGVDNRGLYAIATLCTNLKVLDISHCAKITSHGIMYLSEFAPAQVQQLTSINIINSHLPSDITYALFCALEDRGFNGSVFGLVQDPRDRDVTHVREFRGPPLAPGQTRPRKLVQAYERSPDCIVDLAMHDITQRVLTSLPPDPTTHTTYYCLDLSDCLINDRLLDMILNYWGSRLHTLRVDGTYITQKGLEYFERCPELRILSMARCWNIIYKSEANRSIMAAINRMLSLRQVNVADSRLSGRMLSEHPRLRLTAYNATRCPISVHAVRMLATECHDTMTHLILSGCSFLNTKAIHYFLKFTRLVHLDLSYCTGLTASDIQLFRRWPPSTLSHLRELVVSGIRDCDGIMCQGLANALTQLSESGEAIRIIGDQHDSKPAVFTGESVMESCPYATILPTIHSAAVATAAAHLNIPGVSRTTTVEEKNVTAPSYMMLAGNEMLHPASSRATALLTQQMSTLTIPGVVKPTPTHTDPSSTYLMMNSTDVIPSEHKQSLYGTESIPTYSHHTQTTRPILSHAPSFFDDAMCTRQSPTLQTSPSTSTQSYHRLDANAMVPDTQHIMAQIRQQQQQQQHGATSPPQQRASITSNTLPIHSHPSLASQASFIPEAYIRMTGADMHPSSQQLAASAAAYVPPPPVSVSSTSMPSPPPMPLPSIPVSIPLTAADSSDAPA